MAASNSCRRPVHSVQHATTSASSGSGHSPAAGVPASLEILRRRPEARVRLLCFPWAGGHGPSDYKAMKWAEVFPDFVEVVAFHWSGRGRRRNDPVWRDFTWIPGEVQACLEFLREKPFAFFGHSMGSTTAYEWARWLTLNSSTQPVHLFLSGTVPPQLHMNLERLSLAGLSLDQKCERLQVLSGMPARMLKAHDYKMLNMILPTIEVDLELADAYRSEVRTRSDKQPMLTCDISCCVGKGDKLNSDNMDGWRDVTTATVGPVRKFPGGHFYFKEHPSTMKDLATCVTQALTRSMVTSKL